MTKKDTRKRIINPKTGRKVLATGSVGKSITKKKTKNKRKTLAKKMIRRKPKNTRKTPTKKTIASRKLANFINRIEGKKVMKVTSKGNIRLSAAQAFRDGAKLGSKHCYDGKCKTLKKDKNGRKFWG